MFQLKRTLLAMFYGVLLLGARGVSASLRAPVVSRASVDLESGVLTLEGARLGRRSSVFMGAEGGGFDRLTVLSADDRYLLAELMTTTPGTYPVVVHRGFLFGFANVTIGRGGPPGPRGEPGPPGGVGPRGPAGPAAPPPAFLGQSCDSGLAVAGFDTAGNIVCAHVGACSDSGAVELCDGLDNNCDGEVDEGCAVGTAPRPAPGELVVTEIMNNPGIVPDSQGEWFELWNATTHSLEIGGCEITDASSGSVHTMPAASSIAIGAGAFFVFANSSMHGLGADFVYPFSLGNSSDGLAFSCEGTVIDEVLYDDGATFPDFPGASMQLDPSMTDWLSNDEGTNWCASTTPFGLGDLGTPGVANVACP